MEVYSSIYENTLYASTILYCFLDLLLRIGRRVFCSVLQQKTLYWQTPAYMSNGEPDLWDKDFLYNSFWEL